MTTRKLESSDWQLYFDEVAKKLPSMRVGISIMGESIGVQSESEDSALVGISYDSIEQVFEVDAANHSHRVPKRLERSRASRSLPRMVPSRSSSSVRFPRCQLPD